MREGFTVLGNWKMNVPGGGSEGGSGSGSGGGSGSEGWCRDVMSGLVGCDGCDVGVCPPYGELRLVGDVLGKGKGLRVLSQDVSPWEGGAYTGEVSAKMLKMWGCEGALVGHSERRHLVGEENDRIGEKVKRLWEEDMLCVLCVGETFEERSKGEAYSTVSTQLYSIFSGRGSVGRCMVAYEPVWSIGTGHVPEAEDIRDMVDHIETYLEVLVGSEEAGGIRTLYGGSVNEGNAKVLSEIEGVDGFLVGGASLRAETFLSIIGCGDIGWGEK